VGFGTILPLCRAAVDAMAKRSSEEDDYPVDNFDIQLENQSGEKLQFSSDDDRKFVLYPTPAYSTFFFFSLPLLSLRSIVHEITY
jgi:hypothetical protein